MHTRHLRNRTATFVGAMALVVLATGALAQQQTRPESVVSATQPPKLVVLIMVDQMRADYVTRFGKDWTAGLHRLVSQGAWFRHAAYPYLTTVTCAGHSTVATGAFPHTTGIIGNAWLDRESKAMTTCVQDPQVTDIAYAGASQGGDSGRLLQVPTFADQMRTERAAHVVSLSLKEDSAIMMAGHGADAVTWSGNAPDVWVTSSAFNAGPVDAVTAFTAANPTAADFGKTWTRKLQADHYQGVDDGQGEAPPKGWTSTFPHELKGSTGKPDRDYHAQWQRSPFADAYLGRFAAALVESMRLGRHEGTTDVLAVGFSSPDLVGHAFGPESQEVQDMYAHLDQTIGILLDRLDTVVGRNEYVVGLSADHGVTPIPEQLVQQRRDGGRITSAGLGALVEAQAKSVAGDGRAVQRVNGNDVYFAPGVYEQLQASPKALQSVVDALTASPGIARVFRREELRAPSAATSSDRLLRAAALSYFEARSGDLIVALKPGWMFAAAGTTHGSANPDDQQVPVVLMGQGIKQGVYDAEVTPADLAPTLAELCGIRLPSAEGHVLREALVPASARPLTR